MICQHFKCGDWLKNPNHDPTASMDDCKGGSNKLEERRGWWLCPNENIKEKQEYWDAKKREG